MSRTAIVWGLCLAFLACAYAGRAQSTRPNAAPHEPKVLLIRMEGAIGPATWTYVDRALKAAEEQNAQCLIIQMDTPGGLLDSTKRIIQSMLASKAPTVVYVAPSGATATSAGCFITMAADVAAMAPATTIGAAHPVQIDSSGGAAAPDETTRKKLENYAASYIQAIAARRNRNAEWAVSAVRESASISAEQAKELRVIEIVASDLQDLLRQLDGREVAGRPLSLAQARVIEEPMTFREDVLHVIGTPEIMFILMLVAVYGIIGELSSPGAILPGVAGGIALILMLYISATLPLNLAGLAMIVLAIAIFIIDAFAPTHGVLTFGGVVAFFLGTLMLFDRAEPMLRISLWLIVPATLTTAAFFVFVVTAGLRAQWLPHRMGMESMAGALGAAATRVDSTGGQVEVGGEYWNATSAVAIAAGEAVRVVSAAGLKLKVEPVESGHE